MNTKMPAICAGLLVGLMALISPLAMGHTNGDNEPSGVYVGPAGPFLSVDGVDFFVGNALCDLEVLSDGDEGSATDNDLDETNVDGDNGGTQTDGTWDDGGFGAVCHTPDTHYVNNGQTVGSVTYPDFNTQNCDFGAGELATGTDLTGLVPWLTTTCDYQTVVRDENGPTLDVLLLNLVGCVLNSAVTVNALEVLTCVNLFLDCAVGDLLMNGDSCPVGPGDDVACGPDGTTDSQNSGPGQPGVPYPGFGACDATDGVAATFVWDAVVVTTSDYADLFNLGQVSVPQTVSVSYYVATTGTVL